jgi:Raf kinase inhibitor-like YbhB/YbcL family protein
MKKAISLLAVFLVAGCAAHDESHSQGMQSAPETIKLTSTAFANDQRIPDEYTFSQENFSPPLAWSNVPARTRELALIVEDPDTPTLQPAAHWLLYKIPPTMTALPARVALGAKLADGLRQGNNSFDTVGYAGPSLVRHAGTHHYHFTLYALDRRLELDPGASATELREALGSHVIGKGTLVGTYSR